MRGIIAWLVLIVVLIAFFIAFGGLKSRTMIIVAIIAAVAGVIGVIFLLRHR